MLDGSNFSSICLILARTKHNRDRSFGNQLIKALEFANMDVGNVNGLIITLELRLQDFHPQLMQHSRYYPA